MLKFFRKIRQQLLNSGEMKKYSLYAVGEIVLVVLGILIALQVNNWNESRKGKKVEIKLLKEIHADIEATLDEVIGDYKSHIRSQNSGTTFQKYLMNNETYNDTIARHYWRMLKDRQAYPKTSGYELMQSKGTDIISNDSLRKEITDLYQLTFSRLVECGQSNERFNVPNRLAHFSNKHFIITNISDDTYFTEGLRDTVIFYKSQLNNYEALRNDKEFFRTLQSSFALRKRKISLHEWAIEDSNEVLTMIENELQNLE